jgi:UDP-N-acetylmuramate dehydrogenase
MRLGGLAKWLVYVTNEEEIPVYIKHAQDNNSPFMMIGVGSNIVWKDEGYDGLIMVNKIAGRYVISEDDKSVTLRLMGGEHWDDTVAWTVKMGWSGLEFLSLIPGTVGAAPVQNIGAYGQELSNLLMEVEAYDTHTNSFGGIAASQCGFGYRTSRFKTTDKGRFIITAIVVKLSKSSPRPPFYEVLQQRLDDNGILEHNPQTIRDAVIDIRSNKLPDPSKIGNNGSFFTNPIVDQAIYDQIKIKHPDVKSWPTKDGKFKLAAGWMIEKAGFAEFHDKETGIGTWHAQSLVLINEHAQSTADLLKFKQKIIDKVSGMFGVTLQQEPELLP